MSRSRLDPAASEFFRRQLQARRRGKRLDAAGMVDFSPTSSNAIPILSIEDGLPRTIGTAGAADRTLGIKDSARRRRPLRHQPEAAREGIDEGVANSILIKLNQIGTLTETLEAVEMAHSAATPRLLASLGRDRGFDHRRPGGGDQCGQIKTGRWRAPTGSPNTTNSSHRRHSAPTPATPGGAR